MQTYEIEHLVERFQSQTLPLSEWTHEAHLIVALWYLTKFSKEEATCYLRAGIILFNKSVGTQNTPTSGYHETLTLFWIETTFRFISQHGELPFREQVALFLKNPVSRKEFPFAYYSRECLFSTQARAFWTAPDLKAY